MEKKKYECSLNVTMQVDDFSCVTYAETFVLLKCIYKRSCDVSPVKPRVSPLESTFHYGTIQVGKESIYIFLLFRGDIIKHV